jgi:DNA-binding transcriptional ArsR family regulator
MMNLIQTLKAIADENRMKILTMLLGGDFCVGALAGQLNISKPAVSQHLKVLRKAGLIKGEKRGYWTHYIVERQVIAEISEQLRKLSTQQQPFQIRCAKQEAPSIYKSKIKEVMMCQNCCQQPDKLKEKPETCSPEQILECHGDTQDHPCIKGDDAPKEGKGKA